MNPQVLSEFCEVPPIEPVRQHDAFLNGYAPEDEGLYDDYFTE